MNTWEQGIPKESGYYWFAPSQAKHVVDMCRVLLGDKPNQRRLCRMFNGWERGRDNPHPDYLSTMLEEDKHCFSLEDQFIAQGYFMLVEQPEGPPK